MNKSLHPSKAGTDDAAIYKAAKSFYTEMATFPASNVQGNRQDQLSSQRPGDAELYLRFVENFYMQDQRPVDMAAYGRNDAKSGG